MLFHHLATIFEQLERTSSGNKMREILSAFLKEVPSDDIDKVCYLTLGSIASSYEDVSLGMADQMIIRSIANAAQKEERKIAEESKRLGDIGLVAEKEATQKNPTITINDIFKIFNAIAEAQGFGSQNVKTRLLAGLLKKATASEAKYITRIALSTLRMGVGDMTVLDSLAIAFTGEKKNKEILEHAYNVRPDVGLIAKTLAAKGLKGVEHIDLTVGIPVQMMLASREDNLEAIKERMPNGIAAEEKYDGERAQIHKKGNKIIIYSRRLEIITPQFPDIVAEIKCLNHDFIIEGEIVPIDKKTKAILPFQTLMQRRRKHDIQTYMKQVPIVVHLFDLLSMDGSSYLKEPYTKRQETLKKLLKKETDVLRFARSMRTTSVEEMEDFFNECIERGTEGIIAKNVDGEYQAGTRGNLWIKWKREYAKELRDTFDFVIVGAFAGWGRRSGTYGALLCAAYNDKNDTFETVCKLGSGFTDKQLEELPDKLKKYKIPNRAARLNIHKDLKPDVWFEPKIVAEVIGADITRSPLHTCAEKNGTGLALRFPRIIRYRDDKKPEQATTSKEVEKLAK